MDYACETLKIMCYFLMVKDPIARSYIREKFVIGKEVSYARDIYEFFKKHSHTFEDVT